MKRKLIWMTVFAIAMGFFEAAVVIYMRRILYPEGFSFPLAPIDKDLATTEILREAATLIMMLSVGILTGRYLAERFAWFIYLFAIWDIFYYVFLKLLIGWPGSFVTWDILFLIPTAWIGPVITPVVASLSMIFLAGVIIFNSAKGLHVVILIREWTGLVFGSLVIILAFVWGFSSFILSHYTISQLFHMPSDQPLYVLAEKYIPESFNWWLFIAGQLVILSTILLMAKRLRQARIS